MKKLILDASENSKARAMSSTVHMENAIPNYQIKLRHLFVFAYVWGFGARLSES